MAIGTFRTYPFLVRKVDSSLIFLKRLLIEWQGRENAGSDVLCKAFCASNNPPP
ncbi:hypothetical protein Q604_UNBC14493G0001, partial [human gut metagenome]